MREITLSLQMLAEGVSLKGGFRSDRNHKEFNVRDENQTTYKQGYTIEC